MALPPPNLPLVSAVVLHYSDATTAQFAINRIHLFSGAITSPDLFTRFQTAWDPRQMSATAVGVRLHQVDITILDDHTATQVFTTTGTKFDGVASGQFSPATAAVVRLSTGFRGQASHGRVYIPFISEEVIANGSLDTAAQTTIQAGWEAFRAAIEGQASPLQVVSYGIEGNPDAVPPIATKPALNQQVTSLSVAPVVGTQRRRQGRLWA